jgi:hypothetical protein
MTGIESWLPYFDVRERHEVVVALPPDQALRLALAIPVAPDPLLRLLFRLRGLRPDGSIEEFMVANKFIPLERTSTSYVAGLFVGRSRHPITDAASWRAAAGPRSIKAALDFRAETTPSGTRLITETRVGITGLLPLILFRSYWLIIGPFSRLIRRRWLRAVVARAAA